MEHYDIGQVMEQMAKAVEESAMLSDLRELYPIEFIRQVLIGPICPNLSDDQLGALGMVGTLATWLATLSVMHPTMEAKRQLSVALGALMIRLGSYIQGYVEDTTGKVEPEEPLSPNIEAFLRGLKVDGDGQ